MSPRAIAVALVLALCAGYAGATPPSALERADSAELETPAVASHGKRRVERLVPEQPDGRRSPHASACLAGPAAGITLEARDQFTIIETAIATFEHAPVIRHTAVARAPPQH